MKRVLPPRASDLFLLMFNLSQMNTKEKVIESFVGAIAELWPEVAFSIHPASSVPAQNSLNIGILEDSYGTLRYDGPAGLKEDDLDLIANACTMLAVLLKRLDQEAQLAHDKSSLSQIVEEETSLLSKEIEVRKQVEHNTIIAHQETLRLLQEAEISRIALLSLAEDEKKARENYRKLNEKLETRVKQRTSQLEGAIRELEAFSYSVSHDLRSPLRAIDGFSRILLEEYSDTLDDEGKRYLHIISDNIGKMSNLIDDLLTFSRVGRTEIKVTHVDMRKMALSAYEEATAFSNNNKINFRVDSIPDAVSDPSLVKQVWANLIGNSIKFTSKSKDPSIAIGGQVIENEHVYYVKDNGVGFEMKYADKIFGVFQRLHKAEDFEGTGVGLAIVLQVISKLGGRVWAESTPNQGAEFYFSLPVISHREK